VKANMGQILANNLDACHSRASQTMVVGKIQDEGNRIVIFAVGNDKYQVIASKPQVVGLNIGDTIEYKTYGGNFGWFVAKK